MGSPANLYEFIVVIHVLSAVIWVGGLLFIPLVVVPASRTLPEPQRPRQLAEVGRRFRHVGWSAVTLSLATGAYMLAHWGATW
ncbi:MAG: copper resistance protein CopD, partial [Bradymonadaceae bacterium]